MINSWHPSKRIAAFRDAARGVYLFFYKEVHAKVHLLAVVVVTFLGLHFNIQTWEWAAVIGCFGLVIGLEMVNSTLERMADHFHPERHPAIRDIKDLAAGAVLIAAIAAAIIGALIFLPKFGLW